MQDSHTILSVCIATYNRRNTLQEAIENLLKNKDERFIIEVTDNASTDGTREYLTTLDSSRIIVHYNRNNIGGIRNMINCIFNCTSKYAFYHNDRDIVDANGLSNIIDILQNTDIATGITTRVENKNRTGSIERYCKGYEAVCHTPYSQHPTGMIFNVELIHKYLDINNYIDWPGIHKYSLLACDLTSYGDYMVINNRMWTERPRKELVHSFVSGSDPRISNNIESCYFYYKSVAIQIRLTLERLLINNVTSLSLNQDERETLALRICDHYIMGWMYQYKSAMSMECLRYNIRPRFITTHELVKHTRLLVYEIRNIFKELGFEHSCLLKWNRISTRYIYKAIKASLKMDAVFIKHFGDIKGTIISTNCEKKL